MLSILKTVLFHWSIAALFHNNTSFYCIENSKQFAILLLYCKLREVLKTQFSIAVGKELDVCWWYEKNDDALAVYWLVKAPSYPTLHKIAIDILCVPATSAAAERVFSQAGLCSSVLRWRLSDENWESEVMMRVNQWLL